MRLPLCPALLLLVLVLLFLFLLHYACGGRSRGGRRFVRGGKLVGLSEEVGLSFTEVERLLKSAREVWVHCR